MGLTRPQAVYPGTWRAVVSLGPKDLTAGDLREPPCFNSSPKEGESDVPAERLSGSRLSYLQEGAPFVPLRPSADWTWPTHTREGNLLYSSL